MHLWRKGTAAHRPTTAVCHIGIQYDLSDSKPSL